MDRIDGVGRDWIGLGWIGLDWIDVDWTLYINCLEAVEEDDNMNIVVWWI